MLPWERHAGRSARAHAAATSTGVLAILIVAAIVVTIDILLIRNSGQHRLVANVVLGCSRFGCSLNWLMRGGSSVMRRCPARERSGHADQQDENDAKPRHGLDYHHLACQQQPLMEFGSAQTQALRRVRERAAQCVPRAGRMRCIFRPMRLFKKRSSRSIRRRSVSHRRSPAKSAFRRQTAHQAGSRTPR
jgi:hypothetical protein